MAKAKIVVIGGTGYAGGNIAAEAARRGHEVVSVSRSVPENGAEGVRYVSADLLDAGAVAAAIDAANPDVIFSAAAPRGPLAGKTRGVLAQLADLAEERGARFGVLGGAGSLFTAEGGPRLIDTPDFPAAFKDEAAEMTDVLDDLRARDGQLDWFYLSPAANFGSFNPGEARGTYRTGGDVLVADAEGTSDISGADLGLAVVDEIETPAHRGERFTVAY
ncbi:NAD(P)-dependent oxidoreductase [Dietzia sp.]|uniref:NAD(P)-dependent oxidoreductase n=1 Tax=Dietzia sp. TaxID=1871616 RepID=UPI002FD9483F